MEQSFFLIRIQKTYYGNYRVGLWTRLVKPGLAFTRTSYRKKKYRDFSGDDSEWDEMMAKKKNK